MTIEPLAPLPDICDSDQQVKLGCPGKTVKHIKTLRVRVKDKHAKALDAMACEVNMVWNYLNELSSTHTKRTGKFFSAYDLDQYTSGAAKEGLKIHSQTLQSVSSEYVSRRKQFKKCKLRWRVCRGSRKSLGWIPFKVGATTYKNGQLRYAGQYFGVWDSYDLSQYKLRSGSFSQDARGRWYANVCVEVNTQKTPGTASVGIDLGLKDFAALSTGEKISAQRIYRSFEAKLATAQRANKGNRVEAIHAKIANQRKDFLHKLSTCIVKQSGAVFVGKVNASGLAKTKMAKSVLDAGWSSFRAMLKYKCDHAAVWFDEVNESYTTQDCSVCSARTGPKGQGGLAVRHWTCSVCGAQHDRDTNAARNILSRGLAFMEISMTGEARADEAVVNKDSQGKESMTLPVAGAGHGPLAVGIPFL